jgi:DNA-binding GntR family transcriptional regulator
MSDHPNYRALSPPEEKARTEYTYAERRAELYDAIERAGHYRNLERSTRQLGDRYGVSHTTIRNDIERILEWKADHLGENIDAELETLKTKAVQEALEQGDAAKAYSIMSEHLRNLQSLGIKEKEPQQLEDVTDGDGGFGTTVVLDSEYVDDE